MVENPNTNAPAQRSIRRWTIALIISVLLVVVPPLIGIAGTVYGMIGAFETLGQKDGSDPEAMAESIGIALVSTATGFVVSFVAIIPLIISIIGLVRARQHSSAGKS